MLADMIKRAKILIVDDQAANVSLLERLLEQEGFTSVRSTLDSRQSLALYADFAPDLILLDLLMPHLDGFAVLEQLRPVIPADTYLPILVLTADITTEAKQRALASGATDFLTKPLDMVEVLLRIRNLLETRLLHLQLQTQNQMLEAQVRERTAELMRANAELREEIAERKRAEAALSASEQRFRALVENSADAIAVTAADGTIVYASPAYGRILGYPVEALVGRNRFELVHPDDVPSATKLLAHILETSGDSVQAQVRERHQDGSWRDLEGALTNLLDEPSVQGLVANFRDVTERKHLHAQLLQAQKMETIGQLAGGIAHDFNNMLSAIIGFLGSAQEQLPEDHPVQRDLQVAEGSAWRAAGLTRQLLAFARKQIVEPQVLNLNDVVVEMDKLLRRLIGEDIELVTLPAADLGQVKADPGQIEQVMANLVVNARDAMPQGGRLTIETANTMLDANYARQHVGVTPGEYVMLAVSDTGSGIDAEIQQRIFEPFFTTKEVGKGTGLGLATCYGIAKQHGGNIWVYSEVGQGTTFKIYVPRVYEAADTRSRSADDAPMSRGTETVLLVEDEPLVREIASHILQEQGYTVLEAVTGGDALRIIHEHARATIALLITDVVMPQMGGKALAEQVISVYPNIKVLFISGYATDAIVHHGRLDPGTNFLSKPFTPAAFARKVREVLDAAANDTPSTMN